MESLPWNPWLITWKPIPWSFGIQWDRIPMSNLKAVYQFWEKTKNFLYYKGIQFFHEKLPGASFLRVLEKVLRPPERSGMYSWQIWVRSIIVFRYHMFQTSISIVSGGAEIYVVVAPGSSEWCSDLEVPEPYGHRQTLNWTIISKPQYPCFLGFLNSPIWGGCSSSFSNLHNDIQIGFREHSRQLRLDEFILWIPFVNTLGLGTLKVTELFTKLKCWDVLWWPLFGYASCRCVCG